MVSAVSNSIKKDSTSKLAFYQDLKRTIKIIETFNSKLDWSSDAGTIADNNVLYITTNAISVMENDNTASYNQIYRTISSADFTKFNDGVTACGTGDFIVTSLYINDVTKFDQVVIKFGSDNSNNYNFDLLPYLNNGLNTVSFKKSSFSTAGTVNWNAITYIRCEYHTVANAINSYVLWMGIQLQKANPTNTDYCTPFQRYNGTAYVETLPKTLGLVNNSMIIDRTLTGDGIFQICLPCTDASLTRLLLDDNKRTNIYAHFKFYQLGYDATPYVTLYKDADNYLSVKIYNGVLTLVNSVGGSSNSVTGDVTADYSDGNKIELFIVKERNLFSCHVYHASTDHYKSIATTLNSPLKVYLGTGDITSSCCLLDSFEISSYSNGVFNNQNCKLF